MPKTKPPIKANPIEPTLRLPKQMKLSPDETAHCARLIRARRQDYWLRYFIEHLLHMDAAGGQDVTVVRRKTPSRS